MSVGKKPPATFAGKTQQNIMSRSNPKAENSHPCGLWLEWKGGAGHLSYWGKNKGDNGERVALDVKAKPFRCIVLDRTSTVRGYSKAMKAGLFSNEVRDTRTDALTVKSHGDKQVIASGLWNDIKDVVTSKRNGGGFAVNLYIAYKDGVDMKIGAIQIGGCALGPWFEFEKSHRKALFEKGLVVGCGDLDTSGGVEFIPPVFGLCEVSAESDMAAKKLDLELQAYLTQYFTRVAAPEPPKKPQVAPAANSPQSEPSYQHGPSDEPPPVDEPPIGEPEPDVPF